MDKKYIATQPAQRMKSSEEGAATWLQELVIRTSDKKGLHFCNPFEFKLIWLRLLGSNQRPID
jgi:hypothetical protein